MSHHLRVWVFLFILCSAVGVGLGLPLLGFSDCVCQLTNEQAERLKTQSAARLGVPALRLQVVRGSATSMNPDAGTGTIAVRGPFGIKTGDVEFRRNGESDTRRSITREIAAWTLLLAGIAVPALGLGAALLQVEKL